MKKLIILLIAVSLTAGLSAKDNPKEGKAEAKPAPVLMGQVIDNSTGETLAGAMIKVKGCEKSVFTDFEGQFEFKDLTPGQYDLEVSLISYKSNSIKELKLDLGDQKVLKVELKR
jgi:hypothetical protein